MEERSLNFLEEIVETHLAEGKYKSIHTRFPPEPNGYLHIGHAASICLNFGLAIKYKGQCNLRFDDTNPATEETEYVESIMNDVKWLGFNWDELHYTSDYFDELYHMAVKLIEKGFAYVDDSTAEEMAAQKGDLSQSAVPRVHLHASHTSALDEIKYGDLSKYSANKAGAKYGTGYFDSQHPGDLDFIHGNLK